LDLVEQGTENKLTLISAPAGSGKTVLLRAWMAATARRDSIAHVALAGEHADRRTFWLDVLAATGRAPSSAEWPCLLAGRARSRH
jgi:LuxR family transcriptional regulator, maltose regulon positive regulatory protein